MGLRSDDFTVDIAVSRFLYQSGSWTAETFAVADHPDGRRWEGNVH